MIDYEMNEGGIFKYRGIFNKENSDDDSFTDDSDEYD